MNAGLLDAAREHENSITTALQAPFTSIVINRKSNARSRVTKSARIGLDRIFEFEKSATPDFATLNRRGQRRAWHDTNRGRDTLAPCLRRRNSRGHPEPVIGPAKGRARWL